MMKREPLNYNGIPYLKYTPMALPIKGSILYLHGLGERGTDLTLLERNEIPKQMLTIEVPYIVIAPLLPANQTGWWENFTNPMVDLMVKQPGHKHVTGISLGGMRTTVILAERPGIFDSASTVCGSNEVTYGALLEVLKTELARIPTIHYYDPLDTTIKQGEGYKSIKQLCADFAGKADITYKDIILSSNYHNIWPVAYQQQNFWAWLESKVSPPAVLPMDPIVSSYFDPATRLLTFVTQSGVTITK